MNHGMSEAISQRNDLSVVSRFPFSFFGVGSCHLNSRQLGRDCLKKYIKQCCIVKLVRLILYMKNKCQSKFILHLKCKIVN